MVPVSPARTTGSLPRIEVMGKTYRTAFSGRVSYISFEPHLAIHDSGKAGPCFLLVHITTYYYALIHTRRLKPYFIAEGDVGTLDVNCIFLAVYFDGYGEKKFQTAIPDIVRAQHKAFHPWRACEDKVFSVISMVRPFRKRPTLQTLVSIVNRVADL